MGRARLCSRRRVGWGMTILIARRRPWVYREAPRGLFSRLLIKAPGFLRLRSNACFPHRAFTLSYAERSSNISRRRMTAVMAVQEIAYEGSIND